MQFMTIANSNYIYLLSFILFVFSIICFFNYKKIAEKINIIDHPNELNVHNSSIPTGSGIIFVFLFLISFFLFLIFEESFYNLLPKNYFVLIASIFILSFVSFYDDMKSVHPIFRLFVQVTLVMFCTSTLYLSNFILPLKLTLFCFIYFWVYLINIINFTDGSDGFLATNSMFFYLGIITLQIFNNITISFYFALIVFPILAAFFIFNKPPAKLFMGDSGSTFLGFVAGYIALESIINGHLNVIISLLAYPILDCTITLAKKVINGHYPWARLFDYYFLIPLKNQKNHFKVFLPNLIFNLINFFLVIIQIYFNLKFLCIGSILISLILIMYYKKN